MSKWTTEVESDPTQPREAFGAEAEGSDGGMAEFQNAVRGLQTSVLGMPPRDEQDSTPAPAGDTDDADSEGVEVPQPEESDAFGGVRARASALGINNVEQFGTPEAAEIALRAVEARVLDMGRRFEERNAEPVQPQANQPEQRPTAEQVAEAFDLGLDDADIAPEIKDKIKAMHSYYESKFSKVADIERKFQAIESERQMQAQRQEIESFDSAVNALGEDFTDLFGQGTINTIAANQTAFENRKKLAGLVNTLSLGYQAEGATVPPMDVLVRQAVGAGFGDAVRAKAEAKAKQTITTQARNRQGQFLANGTSTQKQPAQQDFKSEMTRLIDNHPYIKAIRG